MGLVMLVLLLLGMFFMWTTDSIPADKEENLVLLVFVWA